MTQYVVVNNSIPENVKFDIDHKCHKIKKSSGKLSYKITKDTDNLYLYIDNLDTKPRANVDENEADNGLVKFDLNEILNKLKASTVAGSAIKLLPFVGDNYNAGIVTAVLIDLGLVKVK